MTQDFTMFDTDDLVREVEDRGYEVVSAAVWEKYAEGMTDLEWILEKLRPRFFKQMQESKQV